MTLSEIITAVDAMTPNAFTNETKTAWLSTISARIQTEIWLCPAARVEKLLYGQSGSAELPYLPPAYDNLWACWLRAMIDLNNGEYDKYANSMAFCNDQLANYQRHFAAFYRPAERESEATETLAELTPSGGSAVFVLPEDALLLEVRAEISAAFAAGTTLTGGTAEQPAALFAAVPVTAAGTSAKSCCLIGKAGGTELTFAVSGTSPTGAAVISARILRKWVEQ